jgi:hypothetical protein
MRNLLVAWLLLTIVALVLDIKNDKKTNEIIKQYQQICMEYSKSISRLITKMAKINIIIYSDSSAEEKNEQIEKVIQSSDQTDIDNFNKNHIN